MHFFAKKKDYNKKPFRKLSTFISIIICVCMYAVSGHLSSCIVLYKTVINFVQRKETP